MTVSPRTLWPCVKTLLHSVYDQPDSDSVHAQYDQVIDALEEKLTKVAEHIEGARADLLAFNAFEEADLAADLVQQSHRRGWTRRSAAEPTSSGSSQIGVR
ncbi:hypothetical protein NJ76_23115 [Rhodococcus sp. IITR03]|nr:hypothetical protein NJ76_23115 [Rhodococcus sp. IITR03]